MNTGYVIERMEDITREYLKLYDTTYDDTTAVDVTISFDVHNTYAPYYLVITVDYTPLLTTYFTEWTIGRVEEQIMQAVKNRYYIEEDDDVCD